MTTGIDENGEWAGAIGKTFIAFGSIEHICIVYLKNATNISHKVIDSDTFSKRIKSILKHLEKSTEKSSIYFSTLLKEVQLLSTQRNLIAHNPLLLEVFEFSDGTNYKRKFIASSRTPSDRIDFNTLKNLSERAHELSTEIHKLCEKLLP